MSGPGDEMFCPSCGERIKRTANFCRHCGEPNRKASTGETHDRRPDSHYTEDTAGSEDRHESTDRTQTDQESVPHRDDDWPGESWDELGGWAGEPPKGHEDPVESETQSTDSWWAKALPDRARNPDESTPRIIGVASGLAILGIVILSVLSFAVLFAGLSLGFASPDATPVTVEEVTTTDDDETIALSLEEELPDDEEITLEYSDAEESLIRADDGDPIASFSLNTVDDPDRFYRAGDTEERPDSAVEDGQVVDAVISESGDEVLVTFDAAVEIADEEQASEDFSVFIEEQQDPIGLALIGTAIGQLVGFAGLALWYLRRRGFSWDQIKSYLGVRFPTLKEYGIILGAWILILILSIIVGLFLMEFLPDLIGTDSPEPADDPISDMVVDDPAIVPLLMLFMFVIVGPAEELLFRGVIQARLRERFSAGPAILVATLIFTLVHVITYVGAPAQVAVTLFVLFVTALVLGAVYEYTKNIVVVSLLHGFHNSMVILLTYVGASEGIEPALLGLLALIPL